MGRFGFEDPLWLLLVPLGAVAWWWLRRRRQRSGGGVLAGAALGVPSVLATETPFSGRLLADAVARMCVVGALAGAVVALARPQLRFDQRDEQTEGIDIALAMDVSTSMLARDFEPDRLEASKRVAQAFVAGRPSDQIAVVAFAGEATTLTPLTLDHAVAQSLLGTLRPGLFNDGTAIGMGLAAAVNRLKDSESPSRVAILLTDGMNMGGYIDPMTAAQLAAHHDVRVYTVGVGSNGTAQSPIQGRDGRIALMTVQVRIDEDLLRAIAATTGGRYFRATDNASLEAVYAEIDALEKRAVTVQRARRYRELFAYPLALAVALAAIAAGLRLGPAARPI